MRALRFAGQTALVTGCGRGLGHATVHRLVAEGASVVCHARAEADARRVAGEVGGIPVWGDLATDDGIAHATEAAAAATPVLHVLVHNAGVLLHGGVADAEPADLRRSLAVHVEAPLALTRALLPALRAARGASVVILSSQLGEFETGLGPDRLPYRISKAAASAPARCAALDLEGDAIRVNALHPGWVQTDMGGPQAALPVAVAVEHVLALAAGGGDGPTGRFFFEEHEAGW